MQKRLSIKVLNRFCKYFTEPTLKSKACLKWDQYFILIQCE